MNLSNHAKKIIKRFLHRTPFYPAHMGQYLRERYFFRHLKALPVISFQEVLDAGCGPGGYATRLAVTYPYMKITGYDIKHFTSWNESPKNAQFKRQDLLQLSEENRYDLCLCIDVLEHIPGNRQVCGNIYRALKPGGYFYLHMPDDKHTKRIFPEKFFKEFDRWAKPLSNSNRSGMGSRNIQRTY